MCPCYLEIDDHVIISEGDYNSLFLERTENGYYLVVYENGTAYMKLDYCPYCGRKLLEVE